MLISSNRKVTLSGWLRKNQPEDFASSLRLQKFLFFYESMSKIDGETAEFQSLKGYENGPVFSDVYGDFTYRKEEFLTNSESYLNEYEEIVNIERAKTAMFLVDIMTERELSNLTHEFNIWNSKSDLINRRVMHVSLHESDFNESDVELMTTLRDMYSIDYIDSVDIIWVYNKCFLISKEDKQKLSHEHENILVDLAFKEELENPVYITMSEEGVLLVD
jgi:hypothetical protein